MISRRLRGDVRPFEQILASRLAAAGVRERTDADRTDGGPANPLIHDWLGGTYWPAPDGSRPVPPPPYPRENSSTLGRGND